MEHPRGLECIWALAESTFCLGTLEDSGSFAAVPDPEEGRL